MGPATASSPRWALGGQPPRTTQQVLLLLGVVLLVILALHSVWLSLMESCSLMLPLSTHHEHDISNNQQLGVMIPDTTRTTTRTAAAAAALVNKTLPETSTACPKDADFCTAPGCPPTLHDTVGVRQSATVAMCMIVKDEEAYLDEFVDYHHALGFDMFYIYDNSPDFVLRQWGTEKGCHVAVIPYPGVEGEPPQWTVNHQCAQRALRDHHTWAAWFDADEILVLKRHANIHDFLRRHCSSGAVGVHWLVFGTANRHVYSPQPFTKRFRYRKRKAEPLVKSIARLADVDLSQGNTLRIHYPYLRPGYSQHDTTGRNFTGATNPAWPPPTDVAVLHHYRYKSRREYVAKSLRGQASHGPAAVRVEERVAAAQRGQAPAARWFDNTAWQKVKEYVPRYAAYDLIYPAFDDS